MYGLRLAAGVPWFAIAITSFTGAELGDDREPETTVPAARSPRATI